MGFPHPVINQLAYIQNGLNISLILYALTAIVLSYSSPFVRKNMYHFVIGIFYMFACDFLIQLSLNQFSSVYEGIFLIFTVVTAWYFRDRRSVLLYLLSLTILLFLVYALSPAYQGVNYLSRFVIVVVFTYFFVGTRINTIQRLIEQDLQYKDIIERLNDGILQIDAHGFIVLVNEKFCKLTGYKEEELMGEFSINALIPEEDREMTLQKMEARKQGESERYETRLIRKNKEITWVNVSASPNYDEQGRFLGATSIITNITDRKVAEEELTQYSFELAQTNRELEQKNQELERFAHIASSDLKAPLQTVIKAVDTIQSYCNRNLFDHAKPYLSEVSVGCQRMSDLIDALLLYSVSGSNQMNQQLVDLNVVVDEVIHSLDVHIKANNVELTYNNLPKLSADRVQLIRLFRNLIENAIKFRGVKQPHIEIRCNKHARKEEYVFSVSDNGVGISRDHYEEVFRIFQKGEHEGTPGLGLGLSICKKIVQNHNGRLWLKSTARQGTTFYFTLSAEIPEHLMLEAQTVNKPYS